MKAKKLHKKPLVVALIFVVVIAIGLFISHSKKSSATKVDIETAVVERGTVVSSVSGNGTLEPVTTVDVKSNVGGTIVKLAVDEGDVVKAGQLIAKIDPSDSEASLNQANADYESAKSQVEQAKQALSMQRLQSDADIRSAEQALEASKQSLLQSAHEAKIQPKLTAESIRQAGESLKSAQANLAQLKKATVPQNEASAKSSYEEAQASYQKLEKSLAREKALFAKEFVSQSDLDSVQADYDTAKAQLASAKRKVETIKDENSQQIADAQAKVYQAQSSLETAKTNKVQIDIKKNALAAAKADFKKAIASLNSAQASSYQNQMKREAILQAQSSLLKAKATVDNAKTTVGYTTVVAPRSGVVVKKYAEQGSIVTAGRQAMAGSGTGVTIVEIADISKMRIEADVDETDVGKITLGQKVDVSVDACPNELFPGKVIKIAPEAEVNSNVTTIPVTVELERTDSRLKPEMNATCNFLIGKKNNVLYVPVESIIETDNGKEVAVVGKDGKQVEQKVTLGLIGDDYCEVVGGLKEGETVVLQEDESSSSKSSSSSKQGGPPPM